MIVILTDPAYLADETQGWLPRFTGLASAENGSIAEILTTCGSLPIAASISYAIGYELAQDGTVTEVFTTFGSVPATPELCAVLREAVAA